MFSIILARCVIRVCPKHNFHVSMLYLHIGLRGTQQFFRIPPIFRILRDHSGFMTWGEVEVLTRTAVQKLVPHPKNVGRIKPPPLKNVDRILVPPPKQNLI